MIRTLLTAVALAGLTAAASAQTYVTPVYPATGRTAWPAQTAGTYNYNNPLYHAPLPPTAYYPGGYSSSYAYTNAGDTVPTTYVSQYHRVPVVQVPVVQVPVVETYTPVMQTVYTEYRGYAPVVYPYHTRGRARWR